MVEILEGDCGNHAEGHLLANKMLTNGYFWPHMHSDVLQYVLKCDKCQQFVPILHALPTNLTATYNPWPFAKWGSNIEGPLPQCVPKEVYFSSH